MDSVRKELKIRPGFTPQEDVGRFRGSRQQASDQNDRFIPGTTRPKAQPQSDNPFAAIPSSSTGTGNKTKAQMKNEKRREKKKTTGSSTTKAWDESDDESDEGDIGEAFRAEDARRNTGPTTKDDKSVDGKKDDSPAWPIEDGGQGMISEAGPDGGGAPDQPIPIEPSVVDKKDNDESETTILSPVPPGPNRNDPAAPTIRPETTTTRTPAPTPGAEPEWRTASSRRPQKPHPIQGGRQGPIGLAHPPPIESSKPKPKPRSNRPRQDSSRQKSTSNSNSTPQQPDANPAATAKTRPNEPRVRKEVKIRDSGMGSLADRVKNLVIGTQGADQKKKERPASTPQAKDKDETSSAT